MERKKNIKRNCSLAGEMMVVVVVTVVLAVVEVRGEGRVSGDIVGRKLLLKFLEFVCIYIYICVYVCVCVFVV